MRTVTLVEPGRLEAGESAPPSAIAPGEALVRVRRVGVCGTDLHAFRGRQPFFTYPRILGHELGVEVVEVSDNQRGIVAGARCAVEPYLNCGGCIACKRGKPNCCAHLQVLGVHRDGGMREWITVPVAKLHPSSTLSLDQLALVETLGIGAHAMARARIEPGEWALVLGAGPIGLSVIQFALAAGARVIVADVNADRLTFCRSALGVEHTLQGGAKLLEAVRAISGGELATAVFDASGNQASMLAAFDAVAPGGRLVLVGLVQGELTFDDPSFHRRELSLMASRNSTPDDFTRIIRLMEAGTIDTAPWITHRSRLDALPETFPGWLDPSSRVIKAVVEV